MSKEEKLRNENAKLAANKAEQARLLIELTFCPASAIPGKESRLEQLQENEKTIVKTITKIQSEN